MHWTKERTTWLGTYREKRGTWHGVPYVLRAHTTKGMTRACWGLAVLVLLLLIAVTLAEELLI